MADIAKYLHSARASTMPVGVKAPMHDDLPGDVATLDNEGLAEGEHIFVRMAAIVRARRLDLRLLMDAHDRHNRGFVDISTFRRSLCYAFGERWYELSMTTPEFNEICAPYITRAPQKAGDPMAYVLWQKFTNDVQKMADRYGSGKAGDY